MYIVPDVYIESVVDTGFLFFIVLEFVSLLNNTLFCICEHIIF